MTKINTWDGMEFDTETWLLHVEWIKEPIQTIPTTETEEAWLNEWHQTLESSKE